MNALGAQRIRLLLCGGFQTLQQTRLSLCSGFSQVLGAHILRAARFIRVIPTSEETSGGYRQRDPRERADNR